MRSVAPISPIPVRVGIIVVGVQLFTQIECAIARGFLVDKKATLKFAIVSINNPSGTNCTCDALLGPIERSGK